MKKRCFAALSVLICTILTASSCGAETGELPLSSTASETTMESAADTAAETAVISETEEVSAMEAVDYDGRIVNVLTFSNADYLTSEVDIIAEASDGTTINDAVFERNSKLMEKYNIDFGFFKGGNAGTALNKVSKAVKAGEKAYDIIFETAESAIKLGTSGNLLEVHSLPNLSIDKPWWNQRLLESSAILGNNFFLIGDMNIDTWSVSYVVFFNKILAAAYDIPDLYEIVKSGTWTIDKLDSLTKLVYTDLNGNGEYDENDLYGLAACSVCIDCFWASADVNFVVPDENGLTLQFTDTYYGLWDKMTNLLQKPEMLYTDRPQYSSKRDVYDRQAFKEDRALFYVEGLYCTYTNINLREMKSDFGILPLPKYDEKQDFYRTYTHPTHNSTISFPITAEDDIDMLTKITEDMAFYSRSIIRPAYYDSLLTGKVARDENSIAMLDILTENIIYDHAFLLLFNSMTFPMRSQINNGKPAASWAESSLKKFQKELDKFVEQVSEN